jgi:hypothetical protein
MEQIVECLICGGPQHGLVRRQVWDPRYSMPPVLACGDGQLCLAGARRMDGLDGSRFLLLHPRATGAQILAMMAVLEAQASLTGASPSH